MILRRLWNLLRPAPPICWLCGEPMIDNHRCDECGEPQFVPGAIHPPRARDCFVLSDEGVIDMIRREAARHHPDTPEPR